MNKFVSQLVVVLLVICIAVATSVNAEYKFTFNDDDTPVRQQQQQQQQAPIVTQQATTTLQQHQANTLQQEPFSNKVLVAPKNNLVNAAPAKLNAPVYDFNVDPQEKAPVTATPTSFNKKQKTTTPVAPHSHPEIPYHVLYIIIGVIAFVSFTATLLFGAFVGILFFKYKVKTMNEARAGSLSGLSDEIGVYANYSAMKNA